MFVATQIEGFAVSQLLIELAKSDLASRKAKTCTSSTNLSLALAGTSENMCLLRHSSLKEYMLFCCRHSLVKMKGSQYNILSKEFHNTDFWFFLVSRPLRNGKTASMNACGWSMLTACPAAGMTTNLAAGIFATM
jgi:hypothetical protein